jgi:hypothetical protein
MPRNIACMTAFFVTASAISADKRALSLVALECDAALPIDEGTSDVKAGHNIDRDCPAGAAGHCRG